VRGGGSESEGEACKHSRSVMPAEVGRERPRSDGQNLQQRGKLGEVGHAQTMEKDKHTRQRTQQISSLS